MVGKPVLGEEHTRRVVAVGECYAVHAFVERLECLIGRARAEVLDRRGLRVRERDPPVREIERTDEAHGVLEVDHQAERQVAVDDRLLPRRRRPALHARGPDPGKQIARGGSLAPARPGVECDPQVPVREVWPALRWRRQEHALETVEPERRDPAVSGQPDLGMIALHAHDVDAVFEEGGRDQVLERGGLPSRVARRRGRVNSATTAVG